MVDYSKQIPGLILILRDLFQAIKYLPEIKSKIGVRYNHFIVIFCLILIIKTFRELMKRP